MAPLRSSAAHTTVVQPRQGARPGKELRKSNPNPPSTQAFEFARDDPQEAESSMDNDSPYDSASEEEAEIHGAVLLRKVSKYK